MEAVYGEGWEKNQFVVKNGSKEEVEALMRKRKKDWWVEFGLESEQAFWEVASKRESAKNAGDVGVTFYFGKGCVRASVSGSWLPLILAAFPPTRVGYSSCNTVLPNPR